MNLFLREADRPVQGKVNCSPGSVSLLRRLFEISRDSKPLRDLLTASDYTSIWQLLRSQLPPTASAGCREHCAGSVFLEMPLPPHRTPLPHPAHNHVIHQHHPDHLTRLR